MSVVQVDRMASTVLIRNFAQPIPYHFMCGDMMIIAPIYDCIVSAGN
jgi:hypothetical protein